MDLAQDATATDKAWQAELEKQRYEQRIKDHYKEEYKDAARQKPGFLNRMARRLDEANKKVAKTLRLKSADLSAVGSIVAMFGGIAACAAMLSILPFAAGFAALWAVNMPDIKIDSDAKKAMQADIDNGTLQKRYAKEVTMGGQEFSRVEPPPIVSKLAATPASSLTREFGTAAQPGTQAQPPQPQPIAPPPRAGMTPF